MIGVVGGGAFGAALALALSRHGTAVMLYARRADAAKARLAAYGGPGAVDVTSDLEDLARAEPILLALPMQALAAFLADHRRWLDGKVLVLCCKGIDLDTGLGPTGVAQKACPRAALAVLTGPSFAADIARGLPTALTLACADEGEGERLQHLLSTPVLRLYRTADVTGAELGGALKNVIAIAAGVVVGAGLGDSARAALMTRGYAEMVRLAVHLGARAETLAGLSGFGDLVLTCTSAQSRNFRYGVALGEGHSFDPTVTVEGAATARAVAGLSRRDGIDMPVTRMVAALVEGRIALSDAVTALLSRPLKPE